MVKNLWEKTRFFCGEHSEPVALVLDEKGRYSCPGSDVDQKKEEDFARILKDYKQKTPTVCRNSISADEAMELVTRLSDIMEDDLFSGIQVDYTNTVLKYRNIDAVVFRVSERHIDIKIKNIRAIKGL